MAAPEARFWIDEVTGQAVLHGLEDPDANKRAAVYREWSEEHGGGDVFDAMHEPTGFPNRTDTSISFNNGNRTLTVAPTGASFDIYIKGDKYSFTVSQTKQITDTEGTWWFYFDTSGVLTAAQTAPNLRDNAWVAIIYWDATNSVALDLAEERHGVTMDGATHSLLHYTVGTRWESGLAAGDYTIAGDGSADADAQLSIADGVVDDEDLPTIITDDSPQNLAPIAWIPVYYLNGAAPVWRKTGADAFPVIDNATDQIRYNLDTAGTWSNAIATNNYFVAMWIFATTNVAEPIIAVLGQRQDSKLGDAQENNLYESLVFDTLPFQEMKLLFRLIFNTRYPQHSNTPHCKLVDIVDLRSVSNLPAGTYVATAHSSLTGRGDRYSHPASAVSLDLTNLDHLLSGLVAPTTDDVQHAMEVMDDILVNTQTIEADWTWSNTNKINFNDTDIFVYSPADSILELSADGHVRIGSGAQDHLTGTADSLLVTGKFEVDSTAYFDNGVELYGQAIIYNAINSRFQFYETAVGDGLVAEMRYDTDQALLAVGAPLGRQIIVSDAANYTKDYDHADSGHPALYIQSETDPDSANDEWVSIAFPVAYAEINWGSGALNLAGGNVGIGTATVPHGGVGQAKLAIEGTNISAAGPHVQFTTDADDYPLMQMFMWRHDNIGLTFDAYIVGGVWKSSDAGSNFLIYKLDDTLRFSAKGGIAAGNNVVTWDESFRIRTNANVVVLGSNQWQFRDTAIHIASLDDGHLDLTADISVDINADMLSPLSAKHYFDAGAAIGTEWWTSDADTYLDAHFAGGVRFTSAVPNLLLTIYPLGAAPTQTVIAAPDDLRLYADGAERLWLRSQGLWFGNHAYLQSDNRKLFFGGGSDFSIYFSGAHAYYYATGVTGTAKHYFGTTGTEELVAGKYHVTAAGTEYAGSDAAGYYDIHALTAARFNADIFMVDGLNIILDTTTGTELGTAAAQKLGFWGATPVVQESHIADPASTIAGNNAAIIAILAQMAATGMQAAA